MKKSWWLWFLALIGLETINILTVSWVITGPWGAPLGLAFALVGVLGVLITPTSPNWVNPVWSVVSLVVNGAIIGTAAQTAVVFFSLGDPFIAMVMAATVFAAAHVGLVYKIRPAVRD